MAREWIAVTQDVALDEIELDVDVQVPNADGTLVGSVADRLKAIREEREVGEQHLADATRMSRVLAHDLTDAGVTVREVGVLLGVSHQRAHQLSRGARLEEPVDGGGTARV